LSGGAGLACALIAQHADHYSTCKHGALLLASGTLQLNWQMTSTCREYGGSASRQKCLPCKKDQQVSALFIARDQLIDGEYHRCTVLLQAHRTAQNRG